jgi:ATP-dependent HslUV protease, peptidase subunit HslV
MSFELTGNGDVLDPQFSCMAVGSGGSYALSAALALMDMEQLTAEQVSHLQQNFSTVNVSR